MATSEEILAIRGDTVAGTVNLREIDACDDDKENSYAIPSGAVIEIRFPGQTSTVSITTTASEVTVVSASKGQLSFSMTPTKSALLKIGVRQTITLHVTYTSGADRKTFQKKNLLTVEDRAN